jgi:thiol-disulfide isomerase/thioredoxin
MSSVWKSLAAIAVVLTLAGCLNSSAAPHSSFTLLDGSTRSTADLKGKVALINFWATSCTTCVEEMPMLVSTYEKFRGRGYETIAVAMSYDPPTYVVNFAQTASCHFRSRSTTRALSRRRGVTSS